MSYFDNANNKVTRKSFGSKVDKEFKREGVIPVRDRSKDKQDKLAEAAEKYQELNKKVNERRMNELKNQKMYNTSLQEGYKNLKDELIKDFISEICVESLLVDEEVVNENFKNIVELVEQQIDDIGGFDGIKKIAETTNNPVLLNMVSICETTAKKVAERDTKECRKNNNKVQFCLNQVDLAEYDYRKKEMGSETIVNNIKDKVLQVVQDEQKLNSDKQMVISDIQNKANEMEAPVEEAMKFIFDKPGIEEDTLFNSIMRSHYKQLLESNSSAIFESFDYKDAEEPLFENNEFDMSDLDIKELADEDKKEIEDMFINECQFLYDVEDYEYESGLEGVYNSLYENSLNILSSVQATHYKSVLRKVQDELEYIEEKYVHNIQKHARKISDKKLDKSIAKWEQEIEATRAKIKNTKDPVCLDDYREDLRTLEAELKALKSEKSHRGKQLKIAKEANPYMKATTETVKERLNSYLSETNIGEDPVGTSAELEKEMKPAKDAKKVKEEVILCPKCGKEECSCKVAKETMESYINKIEDLCESMNVIINAHDNARNNVIESLTRDIDGDITVVPYLQTKDVNLNNLEFVYKTKIVCETLKNNLRYVEYLEEAQTINRAIDLNIASIDETLEVIKEHSDMGYKSNILRKGKAYLEKVKTYLNSKEYEPSNITVESSNIFKTPEDVERVFDRVKEYYVIESTNKELMELVMAEAIVEYTILETFNTLNLIKYTKDSVRKMVRGNISK